MVSGAISDIGKCRENNQDVFYASNDLSFPLYLVADGMGGHKAGEVASNMALDIILGNFDKNKEILSEKDKVFTIIKESIEEANTKIYLKSLEDEKCKGMGTTITLAYIFDKSVLIGHVGDSRAYLVSGSKAKQVTEDHSYVNELLKIGEITKEEAKTHPKRNMITRAVGTSSIIEMDLLDLKYREEDALVLCSDGLYSLVKENEIGKIISSEENMESACIKFVEMANSRGGQDNITVVAVKFQADEVEI